MRACWEQCLGEWGAETRAGGPQSKVDLDLLRWQLCQREARPPKAVPSPPTPDPKRATGLELESGSRRASHIPSLSLFPFCELRPTGGSEDDASLVKFPGYGHWGWGVRNGGAEGLAGGQAESRGRGRAGAILGPSPSPHPCTHAQTANDHPVCQAKMFPVLATARLNLPGARRKLFPEASALRPPWGQAPHSQPGSRCTPQLSHTSSLSSLGPQPQSELPDLTGRGRSINSISQVRPGTW